MKPFFKRQKMRYFMSIVNTERLRIMNLHQGQRAVTLCCLLAAGTAAAETVTVEAVTDVRPGETQEQIVARMTPQLQDMALKQHVFDLLLGDNLQGRKDHIAENGYKYLDQLDVS